MSNMKHTFVKPMALALMILGSLSSCGKSNNASPATGGDTTNTNSVSYTSNNATAAYNAFNTYLYNPTTKLYYRASDKTGIGAIWTQAIYWDMAMNAYKRTNDSRYLQLVNDIYQGGGQQYAGYDWTNQAQWFIWDDMMWWIIALARGYQVTGNVDMLNHAKAGFAFEMNGDSALGRTGSFDASTGGMEWAWTQPGKTACINYPTVIGAMTLYAITSDDYYLQKAKTVYNWARNNLFDVNNGKVADNKVGNNAADWTTHTYNQASCIGAAVMLFKGTGDSTYLNDAVAAANYTKTKMCDANGILPYEGGEEQGVYNAILAQYMIRLIQDCNRTEFLPWLRTNINTGYGNRNKTTGLTGKNYKTTPADGVAVSCYDASSIPALMQVIPPVQ